MCTNTSVVPIAGLLLAGIVLIMSAGCDGIFHDLDDLKQADETDSECTSDPECPGDEVCDDGECLESNQAPECTTSHDCSTGFDCLNNECVTSGSGDECIDDRICEPGQFCIDGQCLDDDDDKDCESVDDCDAGQVCEESRCLEDPDQNSSPGTCTVSSDCDDGQRCNDHGLCENIYNSITIFDRPGPDGSHRCWDITHGLDSAGAKIVFASLSDNDHNILAYGELVEAQQGDDTETYRPWAVLDGTTPDLNPDWEDYGCPAPTWINGEDELETNFHDQSLVALGCNGWVTVQFIDEQTGEPIHLEDGQHLTISEYGTNCSELLRQEFGYHTQTEDDFYDVSLCYVSEDEATPCDVSLNSTPASQLQTFQVSY